MIKENNILEKKKPWWKEEQRNKLDGAIDILQ